MVRGSLQVPGAAPGAGHQAVRFDILDAQRRCGVDELLGGRVPVKLAAEAHGDVAEMADGVRADGRLDG